jgi:hypothetical protein
MRRIWKKIKSIVIIIKSNALTSLLAILLFIVIVWPKSKLTNSDTEWLFSVEATSQWFPEGIEGNNITGYEVPIIPNIVHYVMLDQTELMFVHYISVKSVLRHQKPLQIIFHCNCHQLTGNYWHLIINQVLFD